MIPIRYCRFNRSDTMKIKWEYLNNEARADHNGLALFARPGSAFIMQGGTEIASTGDNQTLMEGVLWVENWVMRGMLEGRV
jgi:hypothetical protein